MQSTEYLAIACIIVPVIALGVKRMRDRAQELHAAYKVRRVLGRKKNVHRKRGDVVQELLAIDNDTFERMFRMPKEAFMQLEQSIAPILREERRWTVQSEQMAILSSGSAVQSLILLAATIRLCYVGWCFFLYSILFHNYFTQVACRRIPVGHSLYAANSSHDDREKQVSRVSSDQYSAQVQHQVPNFVGGACKSCCGLRQH
jgi:hypothetical protein